MKKTPSLSRFLATEAYQKSSKKPKTHPKKYKKSTKDNSKNSAKINPKISKLLVNFGTILGSKFAQKKNTF
jgi:hypothetical protein